MSDSRKLEFLKGLLIGGLIGAAAGVLFAPKSGRETREDISRKTQELVAKAKEEYEITLEKSRKAYEAAVEKMKDVQEAVKKKASEAEEKVEDLSEKLEAGKGRLKKAIDAGIEAYKDEKEKA